MISPCIKLRFATHLHLTGDARKGLSSKAGQCRFRLGLMCGWELDVPKIVPTPLRQLLAQPLHAFAQLVTQAHDVNGQRHLTAHNEHGRDTTNTVETAP